MPILKQVDVTVRLLIEVDEGVKIDNILNRISFVFTPSESDVISYGAHIVDSEIVLWK